MALHQRHYHEFHGERGHALKIWLREGGKGMEPAVGTLGFTVARGLRVSMERGCWDREDRWEAELPFFTVLLRLSMAVLQVLS